MPAATAQRIGFIIPSANRVAEREIGRHLAADCQAHLPCRPAWAGSLSLSG